MAIIIVFLAGILLSYGGVSAIVLMFVMAPLCMELCRESGIPRYMVPGMILGCIATSALTMPGSPQIQKCYVNTYRRRFFYGGSDTGRDRRYYHFGIKRPVSELRGEKRNGKRQQDLKMWQEMRKALL